MRRNSVKKQRNSCFSNFRCLRSGIPPKTDSGILVFPISAVSNRQRNSCFSNFRCLRPGIPTKTDSGILVFPISAVFAQEFRPKQTSEFLFFQFPLSPPGYSAQNRQRNSCFSNFRCLRSGIPTKTDSGILVFPISAVSARVFRPKASKSLPKPPRPSNSAYSPDRLT